MEDIIALNIGGTVFEISRKLLKKYPDTRLGKITENCENYLKERKQYFYNRNPEIFNVVLDFYRNDEIHFPSSICANVLKKELKYWEITQNIENCCIHSYLKFESGVKLMNKIHARRRFGENTINSTFCTGYLSSRLWTMMEYPFSSITAKFYMVFYFLVVLLSTVVILLSSHPNCREDKTMSNGNNTEFIDFLRKNDYKEKVIKHVSSRPFPVLALLEKITDSFFLVELAVHFAVCPDKKYFFKNLQNIVDIIINIAIIIKFILDGYYVDIYYNRTLYIAYACTHGIAIFRLLRVFRVAVQFTGIRILFLALKDSLKDLIILLLLCLTIAVLFANMIFYAEFSNFTFEHMFEGMWYSIVTMTTVGYGDIYPVTSLGRIVGSACALFGLIMLAVPIAIVAGNFTNYYKKHSEFHTIKEYEADTRNQDVVL